MMKGFYIFFCKLIFFSFFLLLSCQTLTTGVTDNQIAAGLKGTVIDTTGNPLKDVKIFCLYYAYNIPPDVSGKQSLSKIATNGSFDFGLEQNLPNPFSNSTFIRFSLPDSAEINFQIIDKFNGKTIYQFSELLSGGYYQRYLEKIVENYQMRNGPFRYVLSAVISDSVYADTLELFVISDKGTPNVTTCAKGKFQFDYRQIFAGDSITIKALWDYSSTIYLGNTVNLLFEKEGYQDKLITVTLYPDVVLNEDVVLIEEEEK